MPRFLLLLLRSLIVFSIVLLGVTLAEAQDKTELRLRLTQGQVFNQVLAMQQKMSQTVLKERIDLTSSMRFGLRNEVLEAGSNTIRLKTTYETIAIQTISPGRDNLTSRYDSTKPTKATDPSTQMMAKLVGKSFATTISSRGEVLKIEGLEILVQRMVASLKLPAAQQAEFSRNVKQSLASQSRQMVNPPVFPEIAVAIGDSWEAQKTQIGLLPLLVSTQYTLTALKNSNATLTIRSKLNLNQQMQTTGILGTLNISYGLSGTQNGLTRINIATGLAREFEFHQHLAGHVSMTEKTTRKNTRTGKIPPDTTMSFPVYIKTTIRGWTTTAR